MASYSYDHPNYTVRREHSAGTVSAVTAGGRFRVMQTSILKAVHFLPVTLNTVTLAYYNILEGASTIASVVVGVAAVGTAVTKTLNYTLDNGAAITVQGVNSSVASVDVIYEYFTQPGAAVT